MKGRERHVKRSQSGCLGAARESVGLGLGLGKKNFFFFPSAKVRLEKNAPQVNPSESH
jgi:hypothetical protein